MKAGKVIIIVGIALVAFIGTSWAAPVAYPNKPIRVLIGFPPGASQDIMFRALMPAAEKILGQPFVIDYRPGAAGVLALELLKQVKPDGYTLIVMSDSALTKSPHMVNVSYGPGDFASLVVIYIIPSGVVVKSDSPFKTFQDLIEYARKNPGQLTIGIPGFGTNSHLGLTRLANREKVKFELVPFQGSAPVTTAILGGHIMSASYIPFAFMPHVRAGTLRALVVFAHERLGGLPDVPTSDDLGFGLEVSNMFGSIGSIAAPKALPKTVKDRLITVFSEGIKSPEYRNLASQSFMTLTDPPLVGEELDKFYRTQYELGGETIRQLGLQKK